MPKEKVPILLFPYYLQYYWFRTQWISHRLNPVTGIKKVKGIAMLEFQLFRIHVDLGKKLPLYPDNRPTPASTLVKLIVEQPTTELPERKSWGIGNVQKIGNDGLYFRFGKTTKSTIETYTNKNFIDQEFDTSPYTHIVLHIPTEIVAIAKKQKLGPSRRSIGKHLARLLNESELQKELRAAITISEVIDPTTFLEDLKNAYSISRFTLQLSRPNPIDAEEYLVKPSQQVILQANGERGTFQITGKALDSEPLEQLTRSAAATGNDASARICRKEGDPPTISKLKGRAVTITAAELDDLSQQETLLRKLLRAYELVRSKVR